MNSKTARKTRQLYRRTVRKTAQGLGKELGNAMKPKPKWIPGKMWMWMLGFFIKLK